MNLYSATRPKMAMPLPKPKVSGKQASHDRTPNPNGIWISIKLDIHFIRSCTWPACYRTNTTHLPAFRHPRTQTSSRPPRKSGVD